MGKEQKVNTDLQDFLEFQAFKRFTAEKTLDSKGQKSETPAAPLTDEEISLAVAAALKEGVKMEKVLSIFGPYKHGKKYRLKTSYKEGGFKYLTYDTELDAINSANALRQELKRAAGMTIQDAMTQFHGWLTSWMENPESCKTKMYRLKAFFKDAMAERLTYLTEGRGQELLLKLSRSESRQGQELPVEKRELLSKAWGVPLEEVPLRLIRYDTLKGVVSVVKEFGNYCFEQKLGVKKDVFRDLKAKGKPAKRKAVLRDDEAIKFWNYAHQLAKLGDQQAIALMATLDMGLRSSEITGRLVKDLSSDGSTIFIETAKSATSEGRVNVGKDIRGYLLKLAAGRDPNDRLFPALADIKDAKGWLLRGMRKLCSEAQVSSSTVQCLRRTAASMVTTARGMQVASILAGHTNMTVTGRHYVDPALDAERNNNRVRELLATPANEN